MRSLMINRCHAYGKQYIHIYMLSAITEL